MPGSQQKPEVVEHLERRVLGHLRAAMAENKMGVTETARFLGEDKGALSVMLRGERSPSLYLAFRIQERFNIPAAELLNTDPPEEFCRPGVPQAEERKYAVRRPKGAGTAPPSGASRGAAAHPEKRKTRTGGGR